MLIEIISVILVIYGVLRALLVYDALSAFICISSGAILLLYMETSDVLLSCIAGLFAGILFTVCLIFVGGDDL